MSLMDLTRRHDGVYALGVDSGAQSSRRASWQGRVSALGIGTVVAVVASELILRLVLPAAETSPGELWWFRDGGSAVTAQYTVDAEMGFRPRLGSRKYGEQGALVNDYELTKAPGVTRLLFIGDSVTARGRIVAGLRRRCEDPDLEWWNAGVESFNTRQEVDYYRRYNAGIDPDHVVLTFHPNDFGHTPAAYLDDEGRLVVYAPDREATVHGFLLESSVLYRLWFASAGPELPAVDERRKDEVRSALSELSGLLGPECRLSVILLPILEPPTQWDDNATAAYEAAVEIFTQLGLRYFDLRPVLERALADGIDVQETPGDPWHPSEAFAERIAASLIREGLLE